jgi:hypothetical protein
MMKFNDQKKRAKVPVHNLTAEANTPSSQHYFLVAGVAIYEQRRAAHICAALGFS